MAIKAINPGTVFVSTQTAFFTAVILTYRDTESTGVAKNLDGRSLLFKYRMIHDPVQHQDPEPEAAKRNSAIISSIVHTCDMSMSILQYENSVFVQCRCSYWHFGVLWSVSIMILI